MAELGPLFPGGAGGGKPLLLHASFLVFRERSMTNESLGQMFIFHGTSDVAYRDHRPWIT
jgi:hypothetical protein